MLLIYKFELKDYFNKTQRSFSYFDAIMKKQKINKTKLLKKLDIPNSTYKRARQIEQNSGKELNAKLCNYFNINKLDESKKEIYEETISQIYQTIYYGMDNEVEELFLLLESHINDNNILKPIFEVFKLLILLTNYENTPKENVINNEELFAELLLYSKFFTPDILSVLKIIELIMNPKNKIDDEILLLLDLVPFARGFTYYALSTQNYLLKDYSLALYYSSECEKVLKDDLNINRQIFIGLTKCVCLNVLGKYKMCYEHCKKQITLLESLKRDDNYYISTKNHFFVACLGLNKNDEVINLIMPVKEKRLYDYIYLLLALHNKKQITEINNIYNEFLQNQLIENRKIVEEIYNKITKKKKINLKEYKINIGLKRLIENIL